MTIAFALLVNLALLAANENLHASELESGEHLTPV